MYEQYSLRQRRLRGLEPLQSNTETCCLADRWLCCTLWFVCLGKEELYRHFVLNEALHHEGVWGSWCLDPLFLSSALVGREWSASPPLAAFPLGGKSCTALGRTQFPTRSPTIWARLPHETPWPAQRWYTEYLPGGIVKPIKELVTDGFAARVWVSEDKAVMPIVYKEPVQCLCLHVNCW
jgi:hypothetical protein